MENTIILLHKSMACPHLEYFVQYWSPYLKRAIAELDEIQRRVTEMIKGSGKILYYERLGLSVLERRQLRGHKYVQQ